LSQYQFQVSGATKRPSRRSSPTTTPWTCSCGAGAKSSSARRAVTCSESAAATSAAGRRLADSLAVDRSAVHARLAGGHELDRRTRRR
jgi:hypothetical protein